MTPSALRLAEYLETNGILTCNRNPWLPSLDDIGCGWTDVTALIDAHALLYCKAFRARTTYLSPKAYFLLRQCRAPRIMKEDSRLIFEALSVGPPLDTKALRWLTGLPSKAYAAAFGALLEDMEITAVGNGNVLNPSCPPFCTEPQGHGRRSVTHRRFLKTRRRRCGTCCPERSAGRTLTGCWGGAKRKRQKPSPCLEEMGMRLC